MGKKRKPSSASQRARRRGSDFEARVAGKAGGVIWRGQDGDVDARGYRIECKYCSDLLLPSTATLRDWLDQVYRYKEQWPEDQKWALAFTGGKRYRNAQIFMIIPFEEWDRLTREAEERERWRRVMQEYPDIEERVRYAVQQLARDYLEYEDEM